MPLTHEEVENIITDSMLATQELIEHFRSFAYERQVFKIETKLSNLYTRLDIFNDLVYNTIEANYEFTNCNTIFESQIEPLLMDIQEILPHFGVRLYPHGWAIQCINDLWKVQNILK